MRRHKQLYFLLMVFLLASPTFAQSPNQMSYQAVIRNVGNVLLSNQTVGVRIRILQYSDLGNSVFIETHTGTTNINGLLTLKIGAGTLVSGNFNTINWSDGPYFLQMETDPTGGTSYSINNISQMLSVPYAMYAETSGADASKWKLTGNEATPTDFIGTTNSEKLQFRINNEKAGQIEASNVYFGLHAGITNVSGLGNVALGSASLKNNTADNLVAIGDSALFSNTIGTGNTAVGSKVLYANTTGYDNTATGYQSLFSNTTGNRNIANGIESMYANTTGYLNTAYGFKSLYTNTIGRHNTGIGPYALYANTTGYSNLAIGMNALVSNTTGYGNAATAGYGALFNNTTGDENTATGYSALFKNTTGNRNVATGFGTLYDNTTGSYNTALGTEADVSLGNLTNATVIGFRAIVNASNKVRLGNTYVTKIEGQVAYSYPSDARFKYNIKNNVPGIAFIKKLQPVTYYFDEKKLDEFIRTGKINNSNLQPIAYKGTKELHTGFLAQDVEKIATELGYHFDGVRAPANDKDNYSLAYSQFIMPLVKAVQEQQLMIEKQNIINEEQEIKSAKQQELIEELQKTIKNLAQKIDSLSASK